MIIERRPRPPTVRPRQHATRVRVGLAGLLLLALLACAAPTSAQIVPCRGIQDPGFKILLDDIFDSVGGTASPLMTSLIFRVSTNLEQLQVESGVPLKVIRCAKRRPSDPSDFKRALVEQLNAHQVVLEVWGTTAQATDSAGAPIHEATVGYVLVPVRFDEFTQGQPAGAFLLSRQAKSVTSVDELVRLVDQSGELAAYAAVSTGVKLLRARDYDRARAQLCRSQGLLTRAAGATPSARDKALIDYVQRLASDVVTQAKADPTYTGVLKALNINAGSCQ
jgi:hypothetical protein